MAQCQGPRAQMIRLYLVFIYIWQEDVAKTPEVPATPRNAKPAFAITWSVGVTIYCSDVFRGGIVPCPLFGVPVMHKYLRIVRKIESCPPPLWNLGRKSRQKNGLNLGEDLFFWSSLEFGRKNGLILNEDLFLVFIILKFPRAPPFENPAYASDLLYHSQ